jgi:phosphatidylserine/phosphatidylglycerophosphate/cardiolipin synthase-like enzyme
MGIRYVEKIVLGILLVLGFAAPAFADFSVRVAEAPTNNLALTVSAIQHAHQSIYLNIYEFTSPDIADALIGRINAGVHVEVLEEGQPVGGMSAAAKGIQAQVVQAMQTQRGDDRFFVMTSKGSAGKRRFRFDHAKYAVIDGATLLIGSENYSPTGNPSPGTKGNRGWEVLIQDATIAQAYRSVFDGDAQTRDGDVVELTSGALLTGRKPPKPSPSPSPAPIPAPQPGQDFTASSVNKITSPDSSQSGLVALIDSARSTLDIQQMTFDSAWSSGTNPLLAAIERAASRGVQVRVLLNDEAVFNHGNPGKEKNRPTADRINQIANAQARIANLKGMGVDYIHNKGVIVDGRFTLISSINWDENSIQHNREAAVVVESQGVAAHYENLFNSDWQVSGGATPEVQLTLPTAPSPLLESLVLNCPDTLHIRASIGRLTLDRDDQSFASIENKTFSNSFARIREAEGCVLSDKGEAAGLSHKSFVEIRSHADGMSVSYEGYTPVGNKLFSVRSKLAKDATLSGSFDAKVFNGSSAREYLGNGTLEIE